MLAVIFGYGIATQALVQPNEKQSVELVSKLWFPSFFITQGEFFYRDNIYAASKSSQFKKQSDKKRKKN